jgi:hypothetical protein
MVSDDHCMAKGAEKRDIRFSLRIPSSLHTRLRKVADADRRTMADFTLIALERAVDEFETMLAARKAEKSARTIAIGDLIHAPAQAVINKTTAK